MIIIDWKKSSELLQDTLNKNYLYECETRSLQWELNRLNSLKHYLKPKNVLDQNKHNRENQNYKKRNYMIVIVWVLTKVWTL